MGTRYSYNLPWVWLFSGLVMAYALFLVWMGGRDQDAQLFGLDPGFALAGAGVAVGLLHVLAIGDAVRGRDLHVMMWWVIVAGGVARLFLFFGEPVAEADFYRYLWDGGMVAGLNNPFIWSPQDVLAGSAAADVSGLLLNDDARRILDSVTYPALPTIYPPLAQLAFAVAHLIAPWEIVGWKVVLLALDAGTLVLLCACVTGGRAKAIVVVIYWLNPLLLRFVHGSLHMDVVLLLCFAGALWAVARSRWTVMYVALILATASKLWPILLVPLAIRNRRFNVRDMVIPGSVTLALSGAVIVFMALQETSVSAFAIGWQQNDALFDGIAGISRWAVEGVGLLYTDPNKIARLIVAAFVCGASIWAAVRAWDSLAGFSALATGVTACLVLLSPAVYPWYGLWLLPFLAFFRSWPLMLLLALLPLYELRFWYETLADPDDWKLLVTWAQAGPVLLALMFQWAMARRVSVV